MSKDDPKSLAELKVGEVWKESTLSRLFGMIHIDYFDNCFMRDKNTVIFFCDVIPAQFDFKKKVTAIFDRRKEGE